MTANRNRAILEPQAIFKIPASGFSFCSLLFLGIKKPQLLDFSKDCGAYFYYLALITRLLNNRSHTTRPNSPATFTNNRFKIRENFNLIGCPVYKKASMLKQNLLGKTIIRIYVDSFYFSHPVRPPLRCKKKSCPYITISF